MNHESSIMAEGEEAITLGAEPGATSSTLETSAAGAAATSTTTDAETTTTDANVEDDSDKEEEDCELQSLQFRFVFGDHPFQGLVWRSLRDAGWDYVGGKYKAPAPPAPLEVADTATDTATKSSTVWFPNSISVVRALDEAIALKPLYSNLQIHDCSHKKTTDGTSTTRFPQAQQWRTDCLFHYHRRLLLLKRKTNGKDGTEEDLSDVSADHEDSAPKPGKKHNARRDSESALPPSTAVTELRRSSRFRKPAVYAAASSVTAVEKGSNLYLHKKTNKNSHAQKKGGRNPFPSTTTTSMVGGLDSNDAATELSATLQPLTLTELSQRILEQHYGTSSLKQVLDSNFLHELFLKDNFESEYQLRFSEWRFLLSTNHNLLLYGGAGSKRLLLEAFARHELDKEGFALVLNGFDPEITLAGIFDVLEQVFLSSTSSSINQNSAETQADNRKRPANGSLCEPGDISVPPLGISLIADADCLATRLGSHKLQTLPLLARAARLGRALAVRCTETNIPIFLVLHNIDGPALQTAQAQDALAALHVNSRLLQDGTGIAALRIVASIDHVDACQQLWTVATSSNFSWIYQEVRTGQPPLRDELLGWLGAEEQEKLLQQLQQRHRNKAKGRLTAVMTTEDENPHATDARVLDVLASLAPRLVDVVQILSKLQLEKLLSKQQDRHERPTTRASNSKKRDKDDDEDDDEDVWITFADLKSKSKESWIQEPILMQAMGELKDQKLVVESINRKQHWVRVPYDQSKLQEIVEFKLGSS